ncbi:MAG: serine/threonine protein kinase [Lysobacter sp.]
MEPIMELDDFKQAWQTLDRRLEQQNAINLRIYTDGKLEKARAGLRPLVWGQVAQIVFGVLLMLMAGSFWADHHDMPRMFVSGLLVHAYGLAITIMAGATLGKISQINYAAPVLGIQKQLAELRRFYIRNGMVAGLSWWVLWVPLMAMLFMRVFGADLYTNAPSVIWIGTGVGIAGLAATAWFHRWSRHPSRPRLAKAMEDSMTGSSLRKAQGVLAELEQFQKE